MRKEILRKKVGQLMVCGFDGLTASPQIKELIREYHIGGVILFARNIGSTRQVLRLTSELQQIARDAGYQRPLLICADQENGVVRRLGTGTTVFPGAMLLSAAGSPENAYSVGKASGMELKALGINWNLAPVVDISNNPENPVIGVRSFGEDPYTVTVYAREMIRGMREAGVITTLKHFPGHGDTVTDSHLDLPVIRHTMERMEKIELMPYRQLIPEGVDAIMTAHIHFPAIDGEDCIPATLSKNIVTGILRNRLGFRGVVTTDCMEMKAVKNTIGTAKGSIATIKAGVDMVMISHTFELQKETAELLVKAVSEGEIGEETISGALERIRKLKERYLSWINLSEGCQNAEQDDLPEMIGGIRHRNLARDIYRKGITLYKNDGGLLPISADSGQKVLVIYPRGQNIVQVEDIQYSSCLLGNAVREVFPAAETFEFSDNPDAEEIASVLSRSDEYDIIIAGTMSAMHNQGQARLVSGLLNRKRNVVLVAMKSPYDFACFPDARACVATYEHTYPALEAAARVIFGFDWPLGKMPVTIEQAVRTHREG